MVERRLGRESGRAAVRDRRPARRPRPSRSGAAFARPALIFADCSISCRRSSASAYLSSRCIRARLISFTSALDDTDTWISAPLAVALTIGPAGAPKLPKASFRFTSEMSGTPQIGMDTWASPRTRETPSARPGRTYSRTCSQTVRRESTVPSPRSSANSIRWRCTCSTASRTRVTVSRALGSSGGMMGT
jgi:hypothetical protein